MNWNEIHIKKMFMLNITVISNKSYLHLDSSENTKSLSFIYCTSKYQTFISMLWFKSKVI